MVYLNVTAIQPNSLHTFQSKLSNIIKIDLLPFSNYSE